MRAVEMAGDGGHRRVGEVVGRHIDRLDRGDRGAGDRGDALLQRRHLGGQRRLVADARRQPAEQAGDLAARLHEAEHVVHQQQHVLVLLVAEILGDGERAERHPPARARRLVHLAVHQHGAGQHAGPRMSVQQFVPLARALADAGEHRDALVVRHHRVDQFHHQHGLADAGAAEHRRLAALGERHQQVDHLDPGLEHRAGAGLRGERRRAAVDRPARDRPPAAAGRRRAPRRSRRAAGPAPHRPPAR